MVVEAASSVLLGSRALGWPWGLRLVGSDIASEKKKKKFRSVWSFVPLTPLPVVRLR